MFVPVVDSNQRPLMPTTPSRARRWIKQKKATPFFKKGVFCVRLNQEPSDRKTQPIAVGIDPGSKREGYTVKSKSHTYLNVQSHAVDWVKDHVETRRNMRRARRFRSTPCRQNRKNRLVNKQKLPPSTKARWQWKLRICKWLKLMFPVSTFVVEDIKAKSWKGARNWNVMFSPLEVGKKWFYSELERLANLVNKTGNDTYELSTKAEKLGHMLLQTYLVAVAIRWQDNPQSPGDRYERLEKIRHLAGMHHMLLQEEARPVAIALFDNPSLIFHLGFDQAQLAPGDWFKQTGHPYTQAIGKILDNLITLPYINKLEFMIADVKNPLSHLQAGCDRQILPKQTLPSSICCQQLETQKIYSFIANGF